MRNKLTIQLPDISTLACLVVIAALLFGLQQRWIREMQNIASPTIAPIILIATQTPGIAEIAVKYIAHTPAPAPTNTPLATLPAEVSQTQNNSAQEILPSTPIPAPTDIPIADNGYLAGTNEGAVWVGNNATPVPDGSPYNGPFLVPATEQPPNTPRLCTGFGDWRDYDPNYASGPVCHKAP